MKKLSKKLKLNKETISTLNNEQMSNVKGGIRLTMGICAITNACPTDSYSIGIPNCIAPPCK